MVVMLLCDEESSRKYWPREEDGLDCTTEEYFGNLAAVYAGSDA